MAKEIEKADDLVKEGNLEEAKKLLKIALENDPKKSTYEDAANIYLSGNMYKEAKEVFYLYKSRTGKDLKLEDTTLVDVEKEEREFNESEKLLEYSGVKVFKARTFKEGYLVFGQPKEIEIWPDKVIFRYKRNAYSYRWDEISDADIIAKELRNKYDKWIDKKLFIKTKDRTLKIDVSAGYNSSFKHCELMLKELKTHLNIRSGKIRRLNKVPGFLYLLPILSIFVFKALGFSKYVWLTTIFIFLIPLMVYDSTYKKN